MKHHVWCNGVNALKAGEVSAEEIVKCPWCGGDRGLFKNYPTEGKTEEQLIVEYFPGVNRVS